jgi:Aspartyl protease
MKTICAITMLLGLVFLRAGAATNPPPLIVMSPSIPATGLPREVSMNKDAGRGNELFITVSLSNGEKLPFLIDTGASTTIIDKSLESELGKRLSTGQIRVFGVMQDVHSYFAPSLFVGNTQLMMTGPYITAYDCSRMSTNAERPVMGILGMDVLSHYCIQLDFGANKIRFLDDQHADKSNWGKTFPLFNIGDGCCYVSQDLIGTEGRGSLIDTGCDYDGWLLPDLYRQWTNQPPLQTNGVVYTRYGILDGDIYPQLYLHGLDPQLQSSGDRHLTLNGLGLQFLSRNLVTLDFPQQTMYLKRTTAGFLEDKDMRTAAKTEGKSALKFLKGLMGKGQLPGWPKSDELPSMTIHFQYPDVVTVDHIWKKGDPSEYHYQVYRPTKDSPWKLSNAWTTDAKGNILKQFPVE